MCVTPLYPEPLCILNQEFENAEGDDYVTELSAQGSPAPQHGPEVYVLPLTKVSLPMAKQPGRSGKPRCGRTPACCTWGCLITGHGVMWGCWGP